MFQGKPFYVPAEKVMIQLKKDAKPDVACRVKHCVPEFEETVELMPALAAIKLDKDSGSDSNSEDQENTTPPRFFTDGDSLARQQILQYSAWSEDQSPVSDYISQGDEHLVSSKETVSYTHLTLPTKRIV